MQVIIDPRPNVTVELGPDEALLFIEFKRSYDVVGQLLGYLNTLKISDMRNTNLVLDIDSGGKVSHTTITKHYHS